MLHPLVAIGELIQDRLNFVHKDETILPAGIAGKLRNMVESGSSGGVTVVVNHSVNAMDAASFQGHTPPQQHDRQ